MSRIAEIFKKPGRKALIGYLTAGYPDIDATLKAVRVLAASGCDLIELGIPFSDPLADGATIQRASCEALRKGVTPEMCLDAARELGRQINAPIVFMTYLNPILRYDTAAFTRACRNAGVAGLIIPDLPPDESGELEAAARGEGLDMIYLLAPNSSTGRIRLAAKHSSGFIYLVSLTGVTGARAALSADLGQFVASVRAETKTPLCVGFGIAAPAQAVEAARAADGVIIGSRLIQLVEEDSSLAKLGEFVAAVRQALDG